MQTSLDQIPQGVVLTPSTAEFKDFRKYINSLEHRPELADQGVVKVNYNKIIPPKSFLEKTENVTTQIFKNDIVRPLEQEIYGSKGPVYKEFTS